mmetsp:Transcript_99054/g.227518  ORF Transcript_99054/g.227518 Transcript_99054/m.227518 type:complete len:359 (+) Transcript_99054:46-1122(+)|eukprot:CAMPEP_0204273166 /NCGR_PEP_ID=MMETSP0468-20130131/22740_1 /ASSEMBLY_ACC=CAM_ASM_000383 /TAXON_ID=2969 /ORGANISM="Oxyrrhis marina" /LENGTH=358 /DNA_ID=CAMNT_0051249131 /DNA_START=39 /DNA_END=1115 /DNA_ORIENTATION=+
MRLSLAIGSVALGAPRDYTGYTFEQYQEEFGKQYNGLDADLRQGIFERNLATIIAHNKEYDAGKQSWYMAVNPMADLTKEELARMRGHNKALSRSMPKQPSTLRTESPESLPDSVDWRTKNVLTPVKNQGQCGSCWAFASTESVESAYAIATGKLIELAPQTYVSCAPNPTHCGGTGGCEGSIQELAFNYTRDHGIAAAADYPYTATDTLCKDYKPAVKVGGYVEVAPNDPDALATALANVGPVAVSVAAEQWSLYGGGIFTGCTGSTGTDVDHVVQAVGYSKDYWVIRNSWGPSWGEGGFIRLSRAKDADVQQDTSPADGFACEPFPKSVPVAGECGVLSDSAYPVGARDAADSVLV